MNRDGAIGISMLLLLLIFAVAAFGTWGVLRRWRHLVEMQHRLDLCVGTAALDLRDRLDRLQSMNRRIREIREAIVAATLAPEARPPLEALLAGVAFKQDLDRAAWSARQATWALGKGCGVSKGRTYSLPSLGLTRPPRDWVGPQPLIWSSGVPPKSWRIGATERPRVSAAQVLVKRGVLPDEAHFSAKWSPRGAAILGPMLGPNID